MEARGNAVKLGVGALRRAEESEADFHLVENWPDLPAPEEPEGRMPFLAPVDVRVNVRNLQGVLVVDGCVNTRLELACARCLQPVPCLINASFSEEFHCRPAGAASPVPAGEKEKAGDEQVAARYFSGDQILLDPIVQEAIQLALPMKLLCRPGCQGLCPTCGCDLNTRKCDCPEERGDPRLSVLKDLLQRLE